MVPTHTKLNPRPCHRKRANVIVRTTCRSFVSGQTLGRLARGSTTHDWSILVHPEAEQRTVNHRCLHRCLPEQATNGPLIRCFTSAWVPSCAWSLQCEVRARVRPASSKIGPFCTGIDPQQVKAPTVFRCRHEGLPVSFTGLRTAGVFLPTHMLAKAAQHIWERQTADDWHHGPPGFLRIANRSYSCELLTPYRPGTHACKRLCDLTRLLPLELLPPTLCESHQRLRPHTVHSST